jgi:Domain of unknown function (DUF4179)
VSRTPLDIRLRRLAVETPDDLVARARSRAAGQPRRRLTPALVAAAAVAALVALVTVNEAAAYFVPAYGRAIADTPLGLLTQPLLRAGGQTAEQVTPIGTTVTSDGHSIQLVGAYADGLQTTIYLQVDGQPLAAPIAPGGKVVGDRYSASMELTDDAGRHYQERGSSGSSATDFEPLRGPAARSGVRLTLRVTRLWDHSVAPRSKHDAPPHVDGNWTFTFTLRQRPAVDLARPAPLTIGDTTYTFTSIRAADTMAVKIRVSGGAVSRWAASGATDAYRLELYNAAGAPQRIGYGSFGRDQIDTSWVLDGSGRYRLHVGPAQGGADYWFDVPRD